MQRGPIKSKFVMHLIGRRKAHISRQSVHVCMCVPVFLYGTALRSWATEEGSCSWPRNNFSINTSRAQALKGTLIFKFSNAYCWGRKSMADFGQFLEDGKDSCPQLALTLSLWVTQSIFPGSSGWSTSQCGLPVGVLFPWNNLTVVWGNLSS